MKKFKINVLFFLFLFFMPITSIFADDNFSCNKEVSIEIRDYDDNIIPNINFEIYKQEKNSLNKKIHTTKVAGGKTTKNKEIVTVNFRETDSDIQYYVLKIWEKNKDYGDFWYYNQRIYNCDKTTKIKKKLPAMNIVIRDGYGNLKKDQKFSIYTQNYDVDGNLVPLNFVSDYETSDQGYAGIYLAPKHDYIEEKNGQYVLSVDNKINRNKKFYKYNILPSSASDVTREYTLSGLSIKFENGLNETIKDKKISFYNQTINKITGKTELSEKIIEKTESDLNGFVYFEYPKGNYAISIEDDLKQDIIFYDNLIINDRNTQKTIILNSLKIKINDIEVEDFTRKKFEIYNTIKNDSQKYYKNKRLGNFRLFSDGSYIMLIAPGTYIITYEKNKETFEKSITIDENNKYQEITFFSSTSSNQNNSSTNQIANNTNQNKPQNLKGYILLQVKKNGEAWYVHPDKNKKYYLKDGNSAYSMMKDFSLGIDNKNLEKIPIGIIENKTKKDYDNDGLSDDLEKAIGTDYQKKDSDNDGYTDYEEIKNGYDPMEKGKKIFNINLINKLKGKILLQVENNGEAWYLNPADGKRYYLKNGNSAFEIMRTLGLGITEEDFEKIY